MAQTTGFNELLLRFPVVPHLFARLKRGKLSSVTQPLNGYAGVLAKVTFVK
jgi:hypothetical protein